MSSLLAELENIVDKKGNMTLLIMREEVIEVEEGNVTHQDLKKLRRLVRQKKIILHIKKKLKSKGT